MNIVELIRIEEENKRNVKINVDLHNLRLDVDYLLAQLYDKPKGEEMLKSLFNKSPGNVKIDKSVEQILELEAQKKRLEMEKDAIKLELDQERKRLAMSLEEERHKQRLKLESEKSVFDREKLIWEKEKAELLARAERERNEFEDRLKKEHTLSLQEAVTLTKLESQQLIKQAELDKDREVTKLKMEYAESVSKIRAEEAEKHYSNLTKAFQELQMNGDKNSRFIQDLALKMFDKVPTTKTNVGIDINQPQLVDNRATNGSN